MGLNNNWTFHRKFWKGRKVLITGHTGFKGSWLVVLLNYLKADIYGLSLENQESVNLFESANLHSLCNNYFLDIVDKKKVEKAIKEIQPEFVIHMAAEALVRRSYREPLRTFNTNVIGTANILEVLREIKGFRSGVFITTDKVYDNENQNVSFKENSSLGGHDPYSASKAASEMIIDSYRKSFFLEKRVPISSARAGNVIGGGDWSEDRLIPDLIRSIYAKEKLVIRNPKSTRPWQHVLDPLFGYLTLAEKQYENYDLNGSYNFGPSLNQSLSVEEIVSLTGTNEFITTESLMQPYEAQALSLDTAKAKRKLYFENKWSVQDSILATLNWYKDFYDNHNPVELCLKDINNYINPK